MREGAKALAAVTLLFVTLFAGPPPIPGFAQTSEIWIRNFGGDGSDWGNSVQQTSDGVFIIAGDTESYGEGEEDVFLVKTDPDGNMLWHHNYGGTRGDVGYSVQQTFDGGYVIAGYTKSFGAGGSDVYVIKTDSDGDKIWDKTIGGPADDIGRSILQTDDGGYVIAGDTRSFGAGSYDVYLIKIDSDGNVLWNRTYGGAKGESGYQVCHATDGGYVIVGDTSSYGSGGIDIFIVRIDLDGGSLWNKTFGGPSDDLGRAIEATTDEGYVIVGDTSSYGSGEDDVYLVKIDVNGNLLWEKTYGGSSWDNGKSVLQTSDGGYIIAGDTESYGEGEDDVYLIKTESDGAVLWEKTIGGISRDNARSVTQTIDEEYVVVGRTWSSGPGGDVYLIKFMEGEPEPEPQPEPEPEPEQEPETEEKPSFWDSIPGFPYESITLGLAIGILVLLLLQRRK